MNILIFVMTMLMLLSLMTYAKLSSYRHLEIKQLSFNYYMLNEERESINLGMETQYQNTEGSKSGSDEKKNQPKTNATRRISVNWLFDKKLRESKPLEFKQTSILFKNLLDALYADQKFYKEALLENPDIVHQLIDTLIKIIDDRGSDKSLKNITEIANFEIPDKKMHEFFYRIMKGFPPADIVEREDSEKKPESSLPKESEDDPKEEYVSSMGYYSLFNFIDLKNNAIRIYLASPEVLNAVYDDSVVKQIIEERNNLFKQVNAGMDAAELTKHFKLELSGRQRNGIEESLLDFTVSKTNPKTYDKLKNYCY